MFLLTSAVSVRAQLATGNSIEDLISNQPAYFLEDNLEINLYGVDNNVSALRIRREFTVKIRSAGGVIMFSEITVPEDFDPTYIVHAPPVKNLGVYFSNYRIKEFAVKIKRGKKSISPKVKKKRRDIESFNIDYIYEYQQHVFTISDVNIGDELKVSYDIDIPFAGNYSRFASFRIFFHESLPKLSYNLTLSRHKNLDFQLKQFNGARMNSEAEHDKIVYSRWKYNNLAGCIDETGSRPHLELPHITWLVDVFQYFTHNSPHLIDVPHYAVVANMRSPELMELLTSVQIGSRSQQYYPFVNMYDSLIRDMNDAIPIREIHRRINDEFKYKPDLDYYRRNDTRGERLGEYFQNQVLRDQSRYNLYYALLVKAKIQFFSAFLIDNRVGEIGDDFFQPTFDNDFLIATHFGEKLIDFIHPKYGRHGWYYNELPFYWEDSKVRLVHITDYATYRYPIKETVRTERTPRTDPIHNNRKHESIVIVDIDFDSIQFKTKIKMGGQFSTMCRGAYNIGPKDKSVNSLYHTPIWKFADCNSPGHLEAGMAGKRPPFFAEVRVDYSINGVIQEDNGMQFINARNWFPFIDSETSYNSLRFLTFYPDFLGTDSFRYVLQFPRPVELGKNIPSMNISNKYGRFQFNISQMSANSIVIECSLQINGGQISPLDFDDVVAIQKAIKEVNNLNIPLE